MIHQADRLWETAAIGYTFSEMLPTRTPSKVIMTKIRADDDSPWKLLLRKYFREAIEFFFPAIAHLIDWSKTMVYDRP